MAVLKPLGALVVIIVIAAYFGFDARSYVMKVGPTVPQPDGARLYGISSE
jgi:hypothetical protein